MTLNSNNVFIACLVLIIMMLSCQADKLFSKYNKNNKNTNSSNTKKSSNNFDNTNNTNTNNSKSNYCLSNQDIKNPQTDEIYKINRHTPCHRVSNSDYEYKYQFKKNEKEKNCYKGSEDPCPYLVNPHAEIPKSVISKCGLNKSERTLDQLNGINRDTLTLNDYKNLLKKYETQIKIKTNIYKPFNPI